MCERVHHCCGQLVTLGSLCREHHAGQAASLVQVSPPICSHLCSLRTCQEAQVEGKTVTGLPWPARSERDLHEVIEP